MDEPAIHKAIVRAKARTNNAVATEAAVTCGLSLLTERTLRMRTSSIRTLTLSACIGLLYWASGSAAWGQDLHAILGGHAAEVTDVSFDPAGTRLVTGSVDSTARVWDVNAGLQLRLLDGHGSPTGVYSVAFGLNDRVATGGADHDVIQWDATLGTVVGAPIPAHTSTVYWVEHVGGAGSFGSASDDASVKLWDADGTFVRSFDGHIAGGVFTASFSGDGATLATGDANHMVNLWDVATGAHLATLAGHSRAVWSVAYSPTEELVASGSSDATVRLWDPATGDAQVVTPGVGTIFALAFSSDGAVLAIAGDSGDIVLWDVAASALLARWHAHDGRIRDAEFGAGDGLLASGGGDSLAKLWDVSDFTADPVAQVAVDIRPGADANRVNLKSKGVIPVAVLTTDEFDATTIDDASVRLGPGETSIAYRAAHREDADGDGRMDWVGHFRTQAIGLAADTTAVSLTGVTLAGEAFVGEDSVTSVGAGRRAPALTAAGALPATWARLRRDGSGR